MAFTYYLNFSHWPDVCGDDTEKRERAFTIYQENRRNQKNVCPNTCLSTNVFFGPLVTGLNEKDKAVGFVRSIWPKLCLWRVI